MAKKSAGRAVQKRAMNWPGLFLAAAAVLFAAELFFLLAREVGEYRAPTEKGRWFKGTIDLACMVPSGQTIYFVDARTGGVELRDKATGAVRGTLPVKDALWGCATGGGRVAFLCRNPFRIEYFEGMKKTGGFMPGGLKDPKRLACGPDGRLFVSEPGERKICAYTADGGTLYTVSLKEEGMAADWGGTLSVSPEGRVVMMDNDRNVREYDAATGRFLAGWRAYRLHPNTVGMVMIECAQDGLYYFMDYNGHGVKVYKKGGAYAGRFSGGRGKMNELFFPGRIASDSDGIYVCTANLYHFGFFGEKP